MLIGRVDDLKYDDDNYKSESERLSEIDSTEWHWGYR